MNNRASHYLFCLAAVAFSPLATLAQTPPQSANDDIVTMIQAGLPETVIVSKIQAGTGRWDTSIAALVALKKKGATDVELSALAGQPAAAVVLPSVPQINTQPVDLMGGQLSRTRQGTPYLFFPASAESYFPDGRMSNTAYFISFHAAPAVLIPTTIAFDDKCVLGNLIVTESDVWFDGYVAGCGILNDDAVPVASDTLSRYTHEDFATATMHKTAWYGRGLKLKSKALPGDIIVGVYPPVKKAPLFGEGHTNTDAFRSELMTLFFNQLIHDFNGTIMQAQTAGGFDLQVLGSAVRYEAMSPALKAQCAAIQRQRLIERAKNGNSWLALAQGIQGTQQVTSGLLNGAVGISKGNASQANAGLQAMVTATGTGEAPALSLPATSTSSSAMPTSPPPTPPAPGKSAFNMNQTRPAQKPSTSATNTSATASSAGRVPSSSGTAAPPVAIPASQSPYVASTPPLTPGFTTSLPIDNCVQQTYVDDNLSFVNHCTQAAYVEWYIGARSGSGDIAPGETAHSGYSSADVVAANGSDYYACPRLYSPVDAKYQRITTAVKHYTCRQF